MKHTQIVLLDPHEIYRIGLRRILNRPDWLRVVGEAQSLQEARTLMAQTKLDVLLMEVQFPDGNGIEFCQAILRDHPHLTIVFLTLLRNRALMEAAFVAGSSGYLLKDLCPSRILHSLETCVQGYSIFPSSLSLSTSAETQSWANLNGEATLEVLSSFERQLLNLIVQGKTNREIGLIFDHSEVSIKKHLTQVYSKLGISRRSQAASIFIKHQPA